ncbi:MAG: hypothetical protein WAK53_16945, partial [Chromatiaceae bacterium]
MGWPFAPNQVEAVVWKRKVIHVGGQGLDALAEPRLGGPLFKLGQERADQVRRGDAARGGGSQHQGLGPGPAAGIENLRHRRQILAQGQGLQGAL